MLQLSQETSKLLFYNGSDVQRRHTEPVSGQKIEKHVVTDVDLHNDDNRPSSMLFRTTWKALHL